MPAEPLRDRTLFDTLAETLDGSHGRIVAGSYSHPQGTPVSPRTDWTRLATSALAATISCIFMNWRPDAHHFFGSLGGGAEV